MSRTEHNFWLDVTIFMALLITTLTGYFLWLVIPHKLDIFYLGFSRSTWVAAHICFADGGSRRYRNTHCLALGLAQGIARTPSCVGCRKNCVPIVL